MTGVHHNGVRHHVTHRPSTSTAWTRAALAAIVLLLSLAAPAATGPVEDAQAAIDEKDYATAIRFLRRAADQGDAAAQNKLGDMYQYGNGVPQHYAEAVRWFRLAADQGLAEAQLSLGSLYEFGLGVPQDNAEAVKWYRLAADQGLAEAEYSLATMYRDGYGVPQDNVRAHMWFSLSATTGWIGASEMSDIVKHMTPAQIAEAQKLAREWQPKRP